ncbi:MAG: hypothetical protein A4S09_16880 [Proteobacteria bacterium SG_bin7]|nr:MAG: hypothetical protein A4S09_16880 [Proteobacteria bacterium SG_bin7]
MTSNILILRLPVLLLVVTNFALAQVDKHSKQATEQTQDLLKNREEREKSSKNDPKAQKAIQDVKNISGGDKQTEDDIFGLASDLMPALVEESNGDPNKMMQILEEAKKDPEKFAKRFSPEQRKKLKEVAEKLGSKASQKPK